MRPTQQRGTQNTPRRSLIDNQQSNTARKHRPDYVLLVITALLIAVGLITIYSISPGLSITTGTSSTYYVTRQFLAIGLGVIGFGVVAALPVDFWKKYMKQLITLSVLAALAVRFMGQEVNGAYRWIQIGGFSFQAVELIKFTLLIWLASFLAIRIREGNITIAKYTLKPIMIALVLIGVVVAGIESDLGSTGVMVAMMFVMCFVAGIPFKKVAIFVGVVAIGLVLAISSSSYRRDRLLTFLHPTQNCQTTQTGYQACQAVIAVGSGGLFGKGLARSVQDYGYLPEANNDSIFAVYAEQFGFVGVVLLLILFMAFFSRVKNIMERAPDNFSRLVSAGVLAWISAQALINIGAMIGLLPLKGITLPFISYGGTSIVFVMIAVGLVFNISRYTSSKSKNEIENIRGSNDENSALWRRDRRPHYSHTINSA
jgi:cell division protein FtsW